MRRSFLTVLVTTLLAAGSVWTPAVAAPGGRVPDFRTRTLDGRRVRLSDLVQKGPVLLNFWAMWCAPCQKELPYLSELQKKYAKRGFTLLAVSEDGEQAAPRVRSFVRGRKFQFTVIVDRNQELYRLFRVSVLPTSLLVGRDLQVLWQHVGYRPGDEHALEQALLHALEGEKQ